MKKRKLLSFLVGVAVFASIFSASALFVSAEVQTVEAPAPTGGPDDAKKMLYPGYVHWGNFADMSPFWGSALDMTQHIWSDFSEMVWGGLMYVELDKNMQASSTHADKDTFFRGVFDSDNDTYYRDLLWYGAFQGVRIDHATFGMDGGFNNNYRSYTVFPGSYVSTALILSEYWRFNAGEASNPDIHLDYKFYTSENNADWVEVDSSEVDFYWEHGSEDGSVAVNGYSTAIATVKLPDDHMYFRVTAPFSGWDTKAGVGPVKVSLSSMEGGATGDPIADTYYAPTSRDQRLVYMDAKTSEFVIKYTESLSVETINKWISQDPDNGSYKFFTADNNEITQVSTLLEDGMKFNVYNVSDDLMFSYTVKYAAPDHVTIAFDDVRKALNPGVVDMVRLMPVPDVGDPVWFNYTDYAGYYHAATPTSPVHIVNRHYGTFFAVPNYGAYRVWEASEYEGVVYRVVPESYVSSSLLLHASLTDDGGVVGSEELIKTQAKRFRLLTSPDGVNWTPYDLQNEDLDLDHGHPGMNTGWDGSADTSLSGFVSVRASMQIPAGHRYYMVEIPDYFGADFAFVGGSKASWTPMTGGETGDEEVDWYPLPEVISTDFEKVLLNESTGYLTAMAEGSITIGQIDSVLHKTLAYVKFFDASDNEITDMETEVESGMKMAYYNSTDDSEVFVFTIDAQITEPPEEPGIESTDETLVVVDEDNGKLIFKSDAMSLQDILDVLLLKGGVELYFYDSDDSEISDLSTLAETGMFAAMYTDVFMGEYELLYQQTHEETTTEPGDYVNFSIVFITLISAGLIVLFKKKKLFDS